MSSSFDFASIYGKADHSVAAPLEPGWYDAIVEEAEFGRTKDGTKRAWTVKFRTTSGDRAGYPLTMTLSINEFKQDGTPNPQGLGIMCRQVHAMGLPFPPPVGEPGERGFWEFGVTLEQTPQYMKGRPVYLKVISDDYDGSTRSKVRDIRPARPGAPTSVPVQQAPQPQYAASPYAGAPDWAQPQQPQGQDPYANPYAPQQPQPHYQNGGYAPQPQQPAFGGYAPQQPPQQPQQQGPVAPGPWQGAQPPAAAPQQQIPGAPGWAQPGGGVPGQGGMGEPPAQGQAPWGQPPQQATPQPQFQPQQPPQGQAPWNGGQAAPQAPQAQFQPPYQQQPQQPQPNQQQPQGAPELPPWA